MTQHRYLADGEYPRIRIGLLAPMPRILKRCYLRIGRMSLRRLEEQIIIALGVKRWIEINKIDRLIGDVFFQDDKVVAEIEFIHGVFFGTKMR